MSKLYDLSCELCVGPQIYVLNLIDMDIQLHAKGLYKVTMNTKEEPNHVVDKDRLFNKMDKSFGFLCLSISKDLIFHLLGLNTLKAIWDQLASLYEK